MSEGKAEDGTTTKRIDDALIYAEPTGPIGRNRAQLRKFLDRLIVEFVTMGIVMFYVSGACHLPGVTRSVSPLPHRRSPGRSPRPLPRTTVTPFCPSTPTRRCC